MPFTHPTPPSPFRSGWRLPARPAPVTVDCLFCDGTGGLAHPDDPVSFRCPSCDRDGVILLEVADVG